MIDRLVPSEVRRSFTLDLFASLLVGAFIGASINFIPVVARRLGADATQLAVIVSVPLAGSLLTPLTVYIPPAQRFRAMLLMWGVGRALLLLVLVITRPGPFVIIVVLYYVIATLPAPAYAELIRSIYPTHVRGRAMAYVRAGMTAVMTVVTPAAGWLMDRVGHGIPFALGALAGLGAIAFFGQIKAAIYPSEQASMRKVVGILRHDRYYAIYSVSLMFLGAGFLIGLPLFPIIQVDDLHLTYADIGVLSLLSSAVWMAASVVMGRLLDRKGALLVMILGTVAQTLISLCYAVALDVRLVALAFAFNGLAAGAGDLAWLNCTLLFAGPKRVSEYAALHFLLLGVRGVIGPLLSAGLLNVAGLGLRQVLWVSVIVQSIGVAIMLWVWRTYRSRSTGVTISD